MEITHEKLDHADERGYLRGSELLYLLHLLVDIRDALQALGGPSDG